MGNSDAVMRRSVPRVLTDVKLRALKPREKPYKLFDAACKGLHLLVRPNGSRLWRMRYWFEGKEKLLALGSYPRTGLKDARQGASEARDQLAKGIDPCQERKAVRTAKETASITFGTVAAEWHTKFSADWTERYRQNVWRRIEKNLLPWLGESPVATLSPPEILGVLRRMEDRGAVNLAHLVKGYASAVFRYAVSSGQATRDPTLDLRGALPPAAERHFAAVTSPSAAADLLRAIDAFEGTFVVASALRLAPYVFVRPSELRGAEWPEIDFSTATWRIPAERMKTNEQHIVPLSRQALAILTEIKPLTGNGRFVFPSIRSDSRPLSENTINVGLRRIGFSKEQMTGHGFRTLASTLLNELGFKPDLIERQLAHRERNAVRDAYNRAEYLDERRDMMQKWADYLDMLKVGGQIITSKANE